MAAKRFRNNNGNVKYLDAMRHRSGVVTLEYDSKLIVDRILKALNDVKGRDAMEYIGLMLVQTVEPYVPQKSRTLLRKGMYLHVGGYRHAKIDLRVRNTKKVPYALYQYYGNVWAPNYYVPDGTDAQNPEYRWVSPKGKKKHQTSRVLGDRKTFRLSNGTVVTLNGYTNPNSQPMWLDYVRNNGGIWIRYTNRVTREIREMFAASMNAKKIMSFAELKEWQRTYILGCKGDIEN